jgi:hypothetical protein
MVMAYLDYGGLCNVASSLDSIRSSKQPQPSPSLYNPESYIFYNLGS